MDHGLSDVPHDKFRTRFSQQEAGESPTAGPRVRKTVMTADPTDSAPRPGVPRTTGSGCLRPPRCCDRCSLTCLSGMSPSKAHRWLCRTCGHVNRCRCKDRMPRFGRYRGSFKGDETLRHRCVEPRAAAPSTTPNVAAASEWDEDLPPLECSSDSSSSSCSSSASSSSDEDEEDEEILVSNGASADAKHDEHAVRGVRSLRQSRSKLYATSPVFQQRRRMQRKRSAAERAYGDFVYM